MLTFEQLGVGDSRLAETEQGSNFGAAPFCSPPRQAQREVGGDRDDELLGDLLDEQIIDLGGSSRKPPLIAEERQQHGEAQPVGVVLRQNERGNPKASESIGDTAYFPGLAGKWRLAGALAAGQFQALLLAPRMLRKRAGLRRIRRLTSAQVRRLIWTNRLRLRDVA